MPARPRKDIVDESEPGFYHCYSRCVRRAFLCGDDQYSGKNYDHRKVWIEDRMIFLASQMAIEVIGYATMDNHFHVILKNRPDITANWSRDEVARRWLTLCPGKRCEKSAVEGDAIKQLQIKALLKDKKKLALCRRRLASISWFMKLLKEHVAKKANAEDEVTGCFWEGRFRSTRLLDSYALLLCSMYVDLNLIRASKASTPETSAHTSAFLRIKARLARDRSADDDIGAASWLSPIDEDSSPPDGWQAENGRRVSDAGFLPMTADKYFALLDWSGKQLRGGKRGSIPAELAPILDRLDLEVDHWLQGIQSFGEWFSDFAGRRATLQDRISR
jgi:hypothetical protein